MVIVEEQNVMHVKQTALGLMIIITTVKSVNMIYVKIAAKITIIMDKKLR